MSIGYYGKRDDDKFAFCSAVKPGESGTFLEITSAIFVVKPPHLWLIGYGLSGDFQNFNDRSWKFEEQLIAVRFCIAEYSSEYQGKKREYKPTAVELALLSLVNADKLLTNGKMMFTGTVNLGQSATRVAERLLELDNTTDSNDFDSAKNKHDLARFILEYSTGLDTFESTVAGYTVQEAIDFVESKTSKKNGSFGGKAKYKTWEERVESTAKILDCEPDFDSLYSKVKKLDADTLIALLELMKLS
ncbi:MULTISPECIES: hypothetical protein [Limnospira]|uniref:Uncharacterized protein n=4 Tax=Limnospira TaxID=2596745 RepID=B5VVT3_LIMMA|nr:MULTISPECIES: hypothetical protein [Limnospira]UWU48034.1 hypothetical protein APLC1_2821 [Arthrospira platensis C1]EDZ91697.1 hypothetical protein AmaxDRAFT_5550 [Limnospira maxima CS-328]EDZ96701.1 hypothetical protein AmaxDRAFT_0625 [Limnospira maxima CS-328]QNH55546.1 MAG: hypothetical protein H2674_13845 [Limnospira indica BM01]CDM95480.1 conserved protein of unknown function [Limnospira indica PCC 8005]